MIPWLAQWAGDVVQKYHVRNDGRTAYEDMTKHRSKHLVVGFGETCNSRLPRTSKTKTNTMANGMKATLLK